MISKPPSSNGKISSDRKPCGGLLALQIVVCFGEGEVDEFLRKISLSDDLVHLLRSRLSQGIDKQLADVNLKSLSGKKEPISDHLWML